MKTNLISVVIPVCNRKDEVVRSVLSVINQSHKNTEIIVVENNSQDPNSIKEALESLKCSKIFFHSISNCKNANQARNFGVDVSNGEFIAFLDSDDTYTEDHIHDCINIMKNPEIEFIYGSAEVWNGKNTYPLKARDINHDESPTDYLFGENRACAPTPSYFCRRSIFDKVRWDENLKRHQDYDFFISTASAFKTKSKQTPAAIVNWLAGRKYTYCGDSMRYFYEKWKSQMSPLARKKYILEKIKLSITNKDLRSFFYFLLHFFYTASGKN